MFASPMGGALPPEYYYPTRSRVNRPQPSSLAHRLSNASSESSNLSRTSSTNSSSSHSSFGSAFPVSAFPSENKLKKKPHQHTRSSSGSSFSLPRPFHKKALSVPHVQPRVGPTRQAPPRPPRPEERREQAARCVPPVVHRNNTQWQFSDLVVRCKQDTYHVDRTIMTYHSSWFARICAIITSPKTPKSVIDLSADDSEAVASMMQYCYQLDYTDKSSDTTIDETPRLIPHVDVYMLAERYGICGLKQLALKKFKDAATTVLSINGCEEQLLQAARAIYAQSRRADADELRQVTVKMCADHVQSFISGDQSTMALVFESMDELPEFRSDLFEEMAARWR